MFFATHFYFCFYHTLSNMALHKVKRLIIPIGTTVLKLGK